MRQQLNQQIGTSCACARKCACNSQCACQCVGVCVPGLRHSSRVVRAALPPPSPCTRIRSKLTILMLKFPVDLAGSIDGTSEAAKQRAHARRFRCE
jgi:hypothetical protein